MIYRKGVFLRKLEAFKNILLVIAILGFIVGWFILHITYGSIVYHFLVIRYVLWGISIVSLMMRYFVKLMILSITDMRDYHIKALEKEVASLKKDLRESSH